MVNFYFKANALKNLPVFGSSLGRETPIFELTRRPIIFQVLLIFRFKLMAQSDSEI